LQASTNLEHERLVKDRIQRFSVHPRLKLRFLFRQQVNLDVRVRSSRHVHSRKINGLDNAHRQLKTTFVKRQQVTVKNKKNILD